MNRKKLAISSSLFAVSFATPPPMNMFVGTAMFLGLKLYKTAIIFIFVVGIINFGYLAGATTINPVEQIQESSEIMADDLVEIAIENPEKTPYIMDS